MNPNPGVSSNMVTPKWVILPGKVWFTNKTKLNFFPPTWKIPLTIWSLPNGLSHWRHGTTVTFSPKITVGKAGSGLHIHSRVMKENKNLMIKDSVLSDVAKTVIAGYMEMAPSLTAFGNMNPTSYFRLVPHRDTFLHHV